MSYSTYLDGSVHIMGDDADDYWAVEGFKEEFTFKGRDETIEAFSYDEDDDAWRFPWGLCDTLPLGEYPDFVDKRSVGRELSVESKFRPREGQAITVSRALEVLRNHSTAMIVAQCGGGKTVMGAEVGLRLRRSMCVLVHKEFLVEQWEEAFRMLCPDITIGRAQQDRCDDGNTHDVVIAMTQSIVRREYPESFYNSFGLLIADEVHRYAAGTWQTAISKFHAKKRLSLTATDRRGDGFWPLITAHFGTNKITLTAPSLVPKVFPIRTTAKTVLNFDKQPWLNNNMKRAKWVTEICDNESRNDIVIRNVLKAHKAGRKVLVISERRNQLDWFLERLRAYSIESVGLFVGGMKKPVRDEAAAKQIVLTTYQMSKEALDIPDLEVLVMASPQSDIEQTVGRILRPMVGKALPVVLDFIDEEIPLFKGFWFNRLRQYKKLHYDIAGKGKK